MSPSISEFSNILSMWYNDEFVSFNADVSYQGEQITIDPFQRYV